MYTGQQPKSINQLQFMLSVEKENRMDKWGKIDSITGGGTTVTSNGKNWLTNEFDPTYYRVYNLPDVTQITPTGNNATQLVAGASMGFAVDDEYFIGPVASTSVLAYPEPNDVMTFGKRPKLNRSVEYPIGGYPYANDEVQMISGSLEGKYRTENLFQSWLGAVCGWVDYHAGNVRWYDQNEYDYVQYMASDDVGTAFTDNTAFANERTAPYTSFNLLPAVEATGDNILICGAELFNSIYFNIKTIGVPGAGAPTWAIEYWSGNAGAWADLTTWIIDDDLGTTVNFDKVDCTLKFQPPHDWIRYKFVHPVAANTYPDYGYLIRIRLSGGTYATTNPVCNYIKIGYIQPTYTLRESFTRGVSPSHSVIHGMHPTKFDLTVQKGESVGFTLDYVAKGHVKPHTMATAPFVTKSERYTQRCYYEGKDITCTWSNPAIYDTNITTFKLTIDTKGDAVPYVGNDGGMQYVDKNVADIKCEVEIPYTNDTMIQQYFSDPNAAGGQIDIAITLRKEKLLASSLQANPDANSVSITLTTAQASQLHVGQMIMLKETALADTVCVVQSINTGTGVVTLIQPIGVDFSTSANVYFFDYVKFSLTNCIILDTDLDDKSSDNPIKRKFTLQPLGDLPTTIPCTIQFQP